MSSIEKIPNTLEEFITERRGGGGGRGGGRAGGGVTTSALGFPPATATMVMASPTAAKAVAKLPARVSAVPAVTTPTASNNITTPAKINTTTSSKPTTGKKRGGGGSRKKRRGGRRKKVVHHHHHHGGVRRPVSVYRRRRRPLAYGVPLYFTTYWTQWQDRTQPSTNINYSYEEVKKKSDFPERALGNIYNSEERLENFRAKVEKYVQRKTNMVFVIWASSQKGKSHSNAAIVFTRGKSMPSKIIKKNGRVVSPKGESDIIEHLYFHAGRQIDNMGKKAARAKK